MSLIKRSLPSVEDVKDFFKNNLSNKARIPVQYGQFIASTVNSVSNLMSTSKGRDKICQVIQHLANFYYTCIKNSNLEEIQALENIEILLSVRIAGRIKESMSSGRKIFKFLKFLDEISSIQRLLQKKQSSINNLKIMTHAASFFYYILDNILWGVSIGVLTDLFDHQSYKKWKKRKDFFSLIKTLILLFITLLQILKYNAKTGYCFNLLQQFPDEIIEKNTEPYEILLRILKKRRKKRFCVIQYIQAGARLVTLYKSLNLYGSHHLNPIFVACCGLFQACFSLFKSAYEKQKFIKLESTPTTQKNTKEFEFVSRSFSTSGYLNTKANLK